jgi:hypothetical protein
MTKPKQAPAPLDPVTVASKAGARSSGWLKLGDGRWTGTVTDVREEHYEVVEMPTGSWRVIDEDGEIVNAPSLERVLKAALG